MKAKLIQVPATIYEMSGQVGGQDIDIPIPDSINMDAITEGDDSPMFVTIEVLNPQISKNKNIWTEELLEDVARQINAKRPVGYLGHIKPEDLGHLAPDPMTIWLAAAVLEVDGVKRLFAKGYVLPEATKLKKYLKVAKAAGNKVAVSVAGMADRVKDAAGYVIRKFDLESIDWARSGSEGVPGGGYLSLTTEMDDSLTEEETMEKEQVIKEMNRSDLEQHNVSLLTEITSSAKQEAVTEMETQITEQTQRAETAELEREKLSKAVSEMSLDTLLNDKVQNGAVRKAVKRMALTEMESVAKNITPEQIGDKTREQAIAEMALDNVLQSEEGKELITEMADSTTPVVDRENTPQSRRFTKLNN